MNTQEGQPINDSSEGIRDAFKDFCGCSRINAAAIVARRTRLMEEVYNATIKRLTLECVEQIDQYTKGEPR